VPAELPANGSEKVCASNGRVRLITQSLNRIKYRGTKRRILPLEPNRLV